MRKNLYFINVLLMIEMTVFCLFQVFCEIFAPSMIFPKISVPLLTLLSVAPMVVQTYIEPEIKSNAIVSLFIAGVTFMLLPMCAGIDTGVSAGRLFVIGTLVYGVTYIIYASTLHPMYSGSHTKLTPVIHGLLLFLASQCFLGLL